MHVILCWEKDSQSPPHLRIVTGTTWRPGGGPTTPLCRPTKSVWACDDVRGLTPALSAALCPECKALYTFFKSTSNTPEPDYKLSATKPRKPYVRPRRGELSTTARRVLETIHAHQKVWAGYHYSHPDGRVVFVAPRQVRYLQRLGHVQTQAYGRITTVTTAK